jgi:hypothetical protein
VDESEKALASGDLAKAEEALKEQLSLQPGNFITLYNLACVRSLQRDTDGAKEYLKESIENGFCDLRQIERDPQLAPLRRTDFYNSLKDNWEKVLGARFDANLKLAGSMFKGDYETIRDEHLRVGYYCGVDRRAAGVARDELNTLAQWADREVFPGILDRQESASDPYVLIVLPNRTDFKRWAIAMFGNAADNGIAAVGGSYEHDFKRLITQDLGASLRHEFFHVLHWRSCGRLNQVHPIWIQEGLCSLVEDYDIVDGRIEPATSWRTNTVKRMDRSHVLITIEQMAKKSHAEFQGSRRLGLYAQARAVFLYLSQKGLLNQWYRTYTEGFAEDPTGVQALEKVLGKPITEIDVDFKSWIRQLPEVPEEMKTGMASLGLTVDVGDGEGPVVESVPVRSAAKLIPGDVITAIDTRSVRDLPELLRLLGQRQPGETVTITYRRGERYGATELALVPFVAR